VTARLLTLAIETSNPSAWTTASRVRPGVAIIDGDSPAGAAVMGVEEIDPAQRHDDDLVPAIDRLTRRLGLAPRDIHRVAASCGPGGFTAVRMAVTIAKSISQAMGAACVPVPSSLVVAFAYAGDPDRPHAERDACFAVALAAKGDDAMLTRFTAHGSPLDRGSLADAARLAPMLGDPPRSVGAGNADADRSTHETSDDRIRVLIADRFLPGPMRLAANAAGVRIVTPLFDPVACAKVSLALPAVEPARVLPIYPRPPEAVRKWRELHGPKA
jgi:tRNA threonylcarbamoyl adenosine modification protein YeaZ